MTTSHPSGPVDGREMGRNSASDASIGLSVLPRGAALQGWALHFPKTTLLFLSGFHVYPEEQ